MRKMKLRIFKSRNNKQELRHLRDTRKDWALMPIFCTKKARYSSKNGIVMQEKSFKR